MTIADQLNGKLLEFHTEAVYYDSSTGIYTFEDGSTAIAITYYKKVDPYIAKSTSTMSIKEYKVWKKK